MCSPCVYQLQLSPFTDVSGAGTRRERLYNPSDMRESLHDPGARQAAEVLGVRRATLSDLLHGKAALSPEMALRIEKAFGVDMEMLLRMQAWHDTHTMRQRADEIAVKPYRPTAPEPC
jgi:antitoxin HigA-1